MTRSETTLSGNGSEIMLNAIQYESLDDVKEDLYREDISKEPENLMPFVEAEICGIVIDALIDSGSEASAISESLFSQLNALMTFPTFPVSGVRIVSAVGNKSKPIKGQALLKFRISGVEYEQSVLIVGSLNVGLVLGVDWLTTMGCCIDFERSCLRTKRNNEEKKIVFKGFVDEDGKDAACVHINVICCRRDAGEVVDSNYSENKVVQDGITHSEDALTSIHIKIRELVALSEEKRKELFEVLKRYVCLFSKVPGLMKGCVCKIKVKEHEPFRSKSYAIPLAKRSAVDAEIKRMLDNQIIERSDSEYSNPIHAVAKRDGTVRIVLDARAINRIILPQRDQPESLECLLQKFKGVKYLSSLDLTSSYWQLLLHEDSRKYTAFLHNGRSYQFQRTPFGLSVSAAAFMRALDEVLGEEILKNVTLYVDDVLITTATWEEHLKILQQILDAFKRAGVTINLDKSEFAKPQIKFLGHIISARGIEPDPAKMDTVRNFPAPRCRKQLKSFIGFCNFFRRFLPGSCLSSPALMCLLKKDAIWKWEEPQQEAFDLIKQQLCNAPILHHPDLNEKFYLGTDSSDYALGAELYQLIDVEGVIEHHTIAFASRALTAGERKFTITEREALAIIWGFEKFRYYLFGRHTIVVTDHKALSFLLSCKLMHNRLTRWAMALQEYSFEIQYVPGHQNVVPDALSRLVEGQEVNVAHPRQKDVQIYFMKGVEGEKKIKKILRNIKREQESDEILAMVSKKYDDPHSEGGDKIRQYYLKQDDILYRRTNLNSDQWKLCIPKHVTEDLIKYIHVSYAHFGPRKCLLKLKENVIFDSMSRKVRSVIHACDLCQKTKVSTVQHKGFMHSIIPEEPGKISALDLYGPLPRSKGNFTHVLVVLEVFSKYVKFYPLRKANSKIIIKKLQEDYFVTTIKPECILSDNGPQFRSNVWKSFINDEGIRHIAISSYRPASNPSERVMRELGRLFRAHCGKMHKKWIDYLSDFETVINSLSHDSTGFPPCTILFGRKPENIFDKYINFPQSSEMTQSERLKLALEEMSKKAQERKQAHDKIVKPLSYKVGDLILIRTHTKSSSINDEIKKFNHYYKGPFRIKKIVHPNSVEVESISDGKYHSLQHVENIKPYQSVERQ